MTKQPKRRREKSIEDQVTTNDTGYDKKQSQILERIQQLEKDLEQFKTNKTNTSQEYYTSINHRTNHLVS